MVWTTKNKEGETVGTCSRISRRTHRHHRPPYLLVGYTRTDIGQPHHSLSETHPIYRHYVCMCVFFPPFWKRIIGADAVNLLGLFVVCWHGGVCNLKQKKSV